MTPSLILQNFQTDLASTGEMRHRWDRIGWVSNSPKRCRRFGDRNRPRCD